MALFEREVEAIQSITSSNNHWLRAWTRGMWVLKGARLMPGYFGKMSEARWTPIAGCLDRLQTCDGTQEYQNMAWQWYNNNNNLLVSVRK